MTQETIAEIDREISSLLARVRELEVRKERLQAAPASRAAAPGPQQMIEFLRARGVGASSSHIFLAPNIPPRKLSGALEGYDLDPEEVILVIDDTLMGSGKDGAVLTATHLLVKAAFASPARFALRDIRVLASEKNRVFVNGREAIKLTMPDKGEVARAFDAIGQCLQQHPAPTSPAVPPPMPAAAASTNAVSADAAGGSAAYAGQSEGERDFLALDRAYYTRLARAVDADYAAGRSGTLSIDARDYNRLVARVLGIMAGIPRSLQRQGIALTRGEAATLSADVIRFETLIYVSTLVIVLLRTESGFDEEQANDFVAQLMMDLMMGYAIEVERLGEKRSLKNVSNPMAVLQSSEIMDMYRRRSQAYMNVMLQEKQDLPRRFSRFLNQACALDANPAKTMGAWTWQMEVVERVLPDAVAFEVLRDISAETEAALIEFFEAD